MSAIVEVAPELIATATLRVETPGVGFTDITENAASFIKQVAAGDGVLVGLSAPHLGFVDDLGKCRSETCSRSDGGARSARSGDAPWMHDAEGPDDMPAHVKSMLNGVSLHVPVIGADWRSAPGREFILSSTGVGRIAAKWFSSSSGEE